MKSKIDKNRQSSVLTVDSFNRFSPYLTGKSVSERPMLLQQNDFFVKIKLMWLTLKGEYFGLSTQSWVMSN